MEVCPSTACEISPMEMRYLAEAVVSLDKILGARRCAVISSDDGVSKHAMYQFELETRAELVTRIFLADEYEDAINWLNSHT